MHACERACSVARMCLTLCDPMNCSLPGSSVHGIFQARVVEWVRLLAKTFFWQPGGLIEQLVAGQISISSVLSSVTMSCPTLCDPMDCSTPGFPVHHQLSELAQTHVHQVGDAIQPSHPLLSSSPAFSLSQHQGLFK